ncbi:MAG: hypothetical protein K6B14_00250 [Lachnospiraceae bacterium]|nr:hypothetical protein [Lachnospiraceae bacterium]
MEKGVRITWDNVQNANEYEVWRKGAGKGFEKVATVDRPHGHNSWRYTDEYVRYKEGKKYTYRIVARHGGEYKSSTSASETIVRLCPIEELKVKQGDGLSIKVSYEEHKNADGYEVRCYDEAIGAFVQIKRTENTDLTFITFYPDKVYSFSVRPYKKSGEKYYFSNWCDSEHIKVRYTVTT